MLTELFSGDTAVTVSFFNPLPQDKHILHRLHGTLTEGKATITHYSGEVLMKVLIKCIFNYS